MADGKTTRTSTVSIFSKWNVEELGIPKDEIQQVVYAVNPGPVRHKLWVEDCEIVKAIQDI